MTEGVSPGLLFTGVHGYRLAVVIHSVDMSSWGSNTVGVVWVVRLTREVSEKL